MTWSTETQGDLVDLLKMADGERRQIAVHLNKGPVVAGCPYAHGLALPKMTAEIERGGSMRARYVVYPVALHGHRLTVLHGAFVHTGINTTVTMKSADQEAIAVRGTVLRCEFLRGRTHVLELKLEQALDAQAFATPAASEGTPAHEAVTPPAAAEAGHGATGLVGAGSSAAAYSAHTVHAATQIELTTSGIDEEMLKKIPSEVTDLAQQVAEHLVMLEHVQRALHALTERALKIARAVTPRPREETPEVVTVPAALGQAPAGG